MEFETLSEQLFADICIRHHYQLTKLKTRSALGIKTADFRVDTPFGSVIAEVEELQANREDKKTIAAISRGKIQSYGGTIGLRVRRAIRHGAVQLKAHQVEALPMIVVLYDNVFTKSLSQPMFFTGPEHIDAALFGDRITYVPLVAGLRRRPDRSGGHRTFTIQEKRYISGIGVISDELEKAFFVYHNPYALNRLSEAIWSDDGCRHLFKPDGIHENPWQWITRDDDSVSSRR